MNTFTSCGLTWYPPHANGECPCNADQPVRILMDSEHNGHRTYTPETSKASLAHWGRDIGPATIAGWFPVNADGTEIKKTSRPRALRRRFKLKTR